MPYKNKEDQKAASRKHYLKNREKVKEFGNKSRKIVINNFKEELCFKKHKIFFSRNACFL